MISNKDVYEKLLELESKVDAIVKCNEKLLGMLFNIDRKTLKPKLKEVADAERRW